MLSPTLDLEPHRLRACLGEPAEYKPVALAVALRKPVQHQWHQYLVRDGVASLDKGLGLDTGVGLLLDGSCDDRTNLEVDRLCLASDRAAQRGGARPARPVDKHARD